MKYLLSLLALVLCITTHAQMKINGKINGGNGRTIQIYREGTDKPYTSVKLDQFDEFSIVLPADALQSEVFSFLIDGNKAGMMFTYERGVFNIEGHYADWPVINSKNTLNADNQSIQVYHKAFLPLVKELNHVYVELERFKANKMTEAEQKAFKEKIAGLQDDVLRYAQEYMTQYPTTFANLVILRNEIMPLVSEDDAIAIFKALPSNFKTNAYYKRIALNFE
ncbi:hypothetical protein LX64_03612 [Chitinophaga skermanii]|uniref:DUF4369 domain-containing protein n=1 Tax=Chitinophaga skermanii TaxID=331697 RepID=A0A327QG23_9BACT|nr:hypothetical protein [Chitinophaga skermanii]RAJ02592.1 hypothetical protein LX64_03612 [Chitinophaga skermanii]